MRWGPAVAPGLAALGGRSYQVQTCSLSPPDQAVLDDDRKACGLLMVPTVVHHESAGFSGGDVLTFPVWVNPPP